MSKKLLIRDLTLRDGQQSQLATRMNQKQIDKILPYYREAGLYAMEVWGGAVPDSTMRYLNENPWDRLSKIKEAIGETSKLTALSRGRNLFGYNPYPEDVIEGFNRNAIESGVDIMRIFDALNDIDNMTSTINIVKKNKGLVDCAVCYTVDPKFSFLDKLIFFLKGKNLPLKVFDVDYFVNKAVKLEQFGADIITIKDMAGLIDPATSGRLIRDLKKTVKTPVDLHTHCTPGYGLASIVMGMLAGVDIVDTVLMNFAGGPAAPSLELVQIFANKLGLDTGVNYEAIEKINVELMTIRQELKAFDTAKKVPRQFCLSKDKLPKEIEKLFDLALEAGNKWKTEKLLDYTHQIEEYFNFSPPNKNVKNAEIPGGMYTNLIVQLETLKVPHLLNKVLKTIPTVRLDAGLTPLVTPTSQIVGAQAVNCIINKSKGGEFYGQTSTQFVNLVKGTYGKTPIPIDPDFREQISGSREERPYDVSNYSKQANPIIKELGDVHLAECEKEELLLELFPAVASDYLRRNKIAQYSQQRLDKMDQQYADIAQALSGNYFA